MVAITTHFEIPVLQTCAPHVRRRAEDKTNKYQFILRICLLTHFMCLYHITKAAYTSKIYVQPAVHVTDLENRINRLTSHFGVVFF